MPLNADILLDRIRSKQQLKRWRLIAIAAFAALALVVFGRHASLELVSGDYIARITVDDVITDDRQLTKLVQRVREDPKARAVLVWLNTPGGSAVGGQQSYLDLLKLSKAKPTVAVMRSMATSAGYLMSLGATHVIASEGTITGSIGVIMESFEVSDLAEKVGVKPIVIKSGPYKGAPGLAEKLTPDQQHMLQHVIDGFYSWFVDVVAERRHLPRETVLGLADGRIYTGKQALDAHLIDGLGGDDEAVEWLEKYKKIPSNLEIRDIRIDRRSISLLDVLSQVANGKISSRFLQKLDGLMAIWQPNSL